MTDFVATWSFEERLGETLSLALPKLGPEARDQVAALLSPQTLAIVAAVLIAWVVSHAFGVGEIIDVIIVGAGILAIGLAVFEGIDHLYEFGVGVYNARTHSDLEEAADHFAKAVSILGIQAVLAFLFRGAPRTHSGPRIQVRGPRTAAGQPYRPTITWRRYVPGQGNLRAGEGWTTAVGDVVLSSRGSARTRQLVLFHERVHQILTPKLYPLRNFRIRNRTSSYERSSLSRYLEEALAETVAQVRVNGMREFFTGIKFPVREGYVYLVRRGADPGFGGYQGFGVLREVAGLIVGGMEVAGMHFDVFLSEENRPLQDFRVVPGQSEDE